MNREVTYSGRQFDAEQYRRTILAWGTEHFRSYPWRATRELYHLLVAEFMLLRTRAEQVVPVYQRFLRDYPSPSHLAAASRQEVRGSLFPLGLRWRADYLYDTAQVLQEKHAGEVPVCKEDILDLPGVSQYIAGAVRCFALDEPEGLIDTNTVRVTGRLFGLPISDSSRRTRLFQRLISALVDEANPRRYNFAILDFAALVCTKRPAPACRICPLLQMCAYGQNALRSGGA